MKVWRWWFRLGVAVILAAAGASAGQAQTTPEPPARAQAFDALQARLVSTAGGTLPVIVGVRAAFTPEGALAAPQAVSDQRAGIAQAQAEVERALPPGAHFTRKFEFIPYMALRADAAALAALRASPWVSSISQDVPEPPALDVSTPLIGAATPVTGAWARGYTGAGWAVAILDTGVDKTNPFITASKVVAEACFSNNGVISSTTSLCPGHAASYVGPGAAAPCLLSQCEHGTHVAGIAAGKQYANMAAATGAGGHTFSGVAPDAQIIPVQVFTDLGNGSVGSYTSDQVAALNYIYSLRSTYQIAAVNMSIGGSTLYSLPCDTDEPARKTAIDLLRSVGIATVIASGNTGTTGANGTSALSTPACISSAISVGSTDTSKGGTTDNVSYFSNGAAYLSLLAPGNRILSSWTNGATFALDQGTSMATPHVTGAWAVLKQAAPTASVSQVLSALQSTGKGILDDRAGATAGVKSRIQLDAALLQFVGAAFINDGAVYDYGGVTVSVPAAHTFTLQNQALFTETLSAPLLSGLGLTQTGSTCSAGLQLGPSQTCTITLQYKPATQSTLSGGLSVPYTPLGATATQTATITVKGQGVPICPGNLLGNPTFENAQPQVTWWETDTIGGQSTPIACWPGACSPPASRAAPFTGGGWAWFGSINFDPQPPYAGAVTVTQIITQAVSVPTGTASLQFMFNISHIDPATALTDTFQALIDDAPVFTATAAEQSRYTPYSVVRVDVGAFATGVTRTLTLSATTAVSTTAAVAGLANFNVDNVGLCSPGYFQVYLPLLGR